MSGNGYARITFDPPNTESWGTVTHWFLYDAAPKMTALDYIKASNVWPKPYPGLIAWGGSSERAPGP
jgi:hypothetical protein